MKYLVVILLCVVPVSVFAMAPMSQEIQQSVGQAAPEFSLPTSSGTNLSLTQARDGKKAILFFWASWCPHCHEELERIRQNIETIKSKGINMLLINGGESRQEAARYLEKRDIPLDTFLDEENHVSEIYQVVGIPTLFFIDEQGIIRQVQHGLGNNYEEMFQ